MSRPAGRSTRRAALGTVRRRWSIAITAAVVIASVAAVALLSAGGGDDNTSLAGDSATAADGAVPAGTFEMMNGDSSSFDDYQGSPLVVNFFASWCVPCLAEMPGFEQVHQDLTGQVAFLGINLQDSRDDGLGVIEQTGITYDVARDPDGALFAALSGFAMPTTVFVDARGQVVELHSGEITADQLQDRIDELLLE